MAIVEIHIENDEIQKISGEDAYVYVHDHDLKETTTMIFKKQEEIYENNKDIRHPNDETMEEDRDKS